MKIVKIGLYVLTGLVVVFAAAVAFIAFGLDAEKYKPELIAVVKAKTGRALSIEEPLRLSVFPRLGITIGKVQLSNPDGSREFAKAGEIRASLAILPLLKRQVVIDRVLLSGMSVDLLRYKLANVELRIEGGVTISGDRAYMYSILLNLFLNSLEAFRTHATKSPVITIEMNQERFVFSDNGPGFPPHVLTALSSGRTSTTRVDGTGLGLFLVRDGAADFGSKTRFGNSPGARIEIRF